MSTLPVTYPSVTTYTSSAALLSIISGSKQFLPWFITNYTQLYADMNCIDFFNFTGRYLYCPWISSQIIYKDNFIKFVGNIHDFIQYNIDNQHYISLIVDNFYISNFKDYYLKTHRNHPLFIYGYDRNTSTYHSGEFFNNGKYQFAEVTFDQLYDAFMNCIEKEDGWVKGISIYSFNENQFQYTFDMAFFRKNLSDYLKPTRPFVGLQIEPIQYLYFGKDAASFKVNEQIERMKSSKPFDLRVFTILYSHKKVIHMALSYLQKEQLISDSENLEQRLINLKDGFLFLQNLAIKFLITSHDSYIAKIENKTKELLELEDPIIEEIINKLV